MGRRRSGQPHRPAPTATDHSSRLRRDVPGPGRLTDPARRMIPGLMSALHPELPGVCGHAVGVPAVREPASGPGSLAGMRAKVPGGIRIVPAAAPPPAPAP
jgi:hypothetical protein